MVQEQSIWMPPTSALASRFELVSNGIYIENIATLGLQEPVYIIVVHCLGKS
jgi:hypothetical protein